jgi:tetratricopeptide (TPR) repeat protein
MGRNILMLSAILSVLGLGSVRAMTLPQVTNDEEHNTVYRRGTQLISPHMILLGRKKKISEKGRREVQEGIACMRAVTAYAPDNWAAFWTMGKGHQVLSDAQAAMKAFASSFEIQKSNPDVAREYASACLDLGLGDKAVEIDQHAISLSPDDAGLHANLALAFLIAGRNPDAKVAIEKALRMAPDDKISLALKKLIDDVIAGKHRQPKNMKELQGS